MYARHMILVKVVASGILWDRYDPFCPFGVTISRQADDHNLSIARAYIMEYKGGRRVGKDVQRISDTNFSHWT